VWPVILAAVCAVERLMAFQQLVHAGMQQGQARNRATAAHADTVLRCNVTRGTSQNTSCHPPLSAERHINAMPDNPRSTPPELVALAAR